MTVTDVATIHITSSSLIEEVTFSDCIARWMDRFGKFILDLFNWISCGFCCRRFETQWGDARVIEQQRGWTTRELATRHRNEIHWDSEENQLQNILLLYGIAKAPEDSTFSQQELRETLRDIYFTELPTNLLTEITHQVWIAFDRQDEENAQFTEGHLRENPRSEQVIRALEAVIAHHSEN